MTNKELSPRAVGARVARTLVDPKTRKPRETVCEVVKSVVLPNGVRVTRYREVKPDGV